MQRVLDKIRHNLDEATACHEGQAPQTEGRTMRSIAIEREFGSGGREVRRSGVRKAGGPLLRWGDPIQHGEKRWGRGSWASCATLMNARRAACLSDLALAGDPNAYSMRTRLYEIVRGAAGDRPPAGAEGTLGLYRPLLHRDALGQADGGAPGAAGLRAMRRIPVARCRRIMETEHVDEPDARSLMRHRDKEREQYSRYFTRKSWGDKANYDIQLNTWGIVGTAVRQSILVDIVRNMP